MVQHKVKQKVKLPQGVKKTKGNIKKKTGVVAPKKGQHLHITPKNQQKIKQFKAEREITKVINADNEDLLRQQSSSGASGSK